MGAGEQEHGGSWAGRASPPPAASRISAAPTGLYQQKKAGPLLRGDALPRVFRPPYGGVLRLPPGRDALPRRQAQRRPLRSGPAGAAGQAAGRHPQNIDGLHQMAGSRNVLELHGSENRYTCLACGKRYDMTCVTQTTGVPRCACGGTIRRTWCSMGRASTRGTCTRPSAMWRRRICCWWRAPRWWCTP